MTPMSSSLHRLINIEIKYTKWSYLYNVTDTILYEQLLRADLQNAYAFVAITLYVYFVGVRYEFSS